MPKLTTIENLKARIDTIRSTYFDKTILGVHWGYIHEIATGLTDYPIMIIMPPKYTVPESRNWNRAIYDMHYFLINQDKSSSGDFMTMIERVAEWGSLELLNKTFIEYLQSTPSSYQMGGEVTVDPNSGGGDQILPDKVIWIEVKFKLIVNDC